MIKQKQNMFKNDGSTNMTPMIDIVFLLIIFFMLVCQFIVAENFEVDVPDRINYSAKKKDVADKAITITAGKNQDGIYFYAVGSEIVGTSNMKELAGLITQKIDEQIDSDKQHPNIVNLRIGKDMSFESYKYILAGVANSKANDIQLAVFKEKTRQAK